MKILGFSVSNSQNSINKSLVKYASSLFENAQSNLLDLNDYEVEIFSVDKELINGIPNKIITLASKIDRANLLIISLAEHNDSYSAAFKNIYDWLSRIPNRKVLGKIPVLLLSTSSGSKESSSVLAAALDRFPRDGSEVLESFYLPNFQDNFSDGSISTFKMRIELIQKVNKIKYGRFKHFYKDDSFTCGIDPTKDDCGDAIEY